MTAKPVHDLTTTGVFLIASPKCKVSSTACGDERGPRTTSSSGMMCAGEKKWFPTTLDAACGSSLAPTTSMSIVDVLVDSTASGLQAFARSAKIACLIATFSTAASMTMSAVEKSA